MPLFRRCRRSGVRHHRRRGVRRTTGFACATRITARRQSTATPTKVIETTAGRVHFQPDLAAGTRFLQQSRGQEAAGRHHLALLPGGRPSEDGRDARPLKELGFAHATKAGISIGIDDMIIPKEKATSWKNAYRQIARGREAVSQRHHHGRRALQQDHRYLDARDRRDLQRHVRAPSSTTRAARN